jgi:hypothetical protein
MTDSPKSCLPGAVVKYCGPTNCRGSRWLATINRGNEPQHKFRASVPFDQGPDAAAAAVIAKANKYFSTNWHFIPPAISIDGSGCNYVYPIASLPNSHA